MTSTSVLRDPAFVRLWAGTTASGLATWALPFVLGLAVLDHTLTATGLGLALAARTAGFLAAVPVGGVRGGSAAGRATLVIAHRLSTIREADHIVLLEEGRVAAEGPYTELAERLSRLFAPQPS
ncbi:hypothetical protein [Nonomuraea mesophila]|uniref:hypothetical protein n=1 Tax=Nonomuraea mesophila TaxID=2530382 RepID=UPI0026C4CC6E